MANTSGKGGKTTTEMTVDLQGAAPQKRRATEQEGGLSLDVIRKAIRVELQGAKQEVRQDIRGFATRINNVESQITRQMQQTINMLDDMTSKYKQHGEILQQLQEANSEVKIRLERLEKGGGGSSAPGSTATPSTEGGKRPALAIGGWEPEQDARTTKQQAENVLRTVEAPILPDQLLVPGVRRGYAILPIDERSGSRSK